VGKGDALRKKRELVLKRGAGAGAHDFSSLSNLGLSLVSAIASRCGGGRRWGEGDGRGGRGEREDTSGLAPGWQRLANNIIRVLFLILLTRFSEVGTESKAQRGKTRERSLDEKIVRSRLV